MGFMQLQKSEGQYVEAIDFTGETHFIPKEDWTFCTDLKFVDCYTGTLYRLSAPGYLDRTDWSPFDSEEEAREFYDEYEEEEQD